MTQLCSPPGDERYSEIYHKLAENRIIFLAEDISKETSGSLSAMMLYYDHVSQTKDITIYINSNGGDASALSNIYDVMQIVRAPISTICLGKAYSSAAILLSAGTRGKRFAMKNSDIMIHGLQVQFPFTEFSDKVDTEIDYKMLEQHNQMIMKILARHTKKKVEIITADCQRDFFLNSAEAIDYGIIDRIL